MLLFLICTLFMLFGCEVKSASTGQSFSISQSKSKTSIRIIEKGYRSSNKVAISKKNKSNIMEDGGTVVRINSVEYDYSSYSNHMYLKLNCTVLKAPNTHAGFYSLIYLNDKQLLDDSMYFMSGSLYEGTNCTMESSFGCKSFTDTTFYLDFINDADRESYYNEIISRIESGEITLI